MIFSVIRVIDSCHNSFQRSLDFLQRMQNFFILHHGFEKSQMAIQLFYGTYKLDTVVRLGDILYGKGLLYPYLRSLYINPFSILLIRIFRFRMTRVLYKSS